MIDETLVEALSRACQAGLIEISQCMKVLSKLAASPTSAVDEVLMSDLHLSRDQVKSLLAGRTDWSHHEQHGETPAVRVNGQSTVVLTPHSIHDTSDSSSAPAIPDEPCDSSTWGSDGATLGAYANYHIEREVARGGLGRVMLAQDVTLHRHVAIKEMLPSRMASSHQVARFFNEAQVIGRLQHPSIVPIHGLGLQDDGRPFYVMKYIQGRTLAELIQQYHDAEIKDPLALDEILRAIVQVCHAVAFAHRHGVLHRDIKPQNIMVGEFGETLLVDWGLAKTIHGSDMDRVESNGMQRENLSEEVDAQVTHQGAAGLTEEGMIVGTPAYMSPEQAQGLVQQLDERTDVFSLGATLYEALTGRAPLAGNWRRALRNAQDRQISLPRQLNSRVPRALEAIAMKALAQSPAERYASASELATEIVRWQTGEPVAAYREPIWNRTIRWARAHRTACASLAASLSMLLLLSAWMAYQERARVESVTHDVRGKMAVGQSLLATNDIDGAADEFRQAQGLLSKEASLADLLEEVDSVLDTVDVQIRQRNERSIAEQKLRALQRSLEDAHIHGMLATSLSPKENIGRTLEAVEQGLRQFDGEFDPPREIAKYDALDKQESAMVQEAARRLRWIGVWASAQPIGDRSAIENREAAKSALRAFDVLDADRQSKAYLLRKADLLALAGEDEASHQHRVLAAEVAAKSAEDFFLTGEVEYRQEHYAEAGAAFNHALQLAPHDFWAQYFTGVCQFRLEKWSEAVASLTACAHHRPDLIYIYLLRGLAHGEMGDFVAAEADFATAERLDSSEYGIYINRGVTRFRAADSARALVDFNKAIELRPRAVQAYLNVAEVHRLNRQEEKAKAVLDRARSIDSREPRVDYLQALLLIKAEDLNAALKTIDRAIAKARHQTHLRASLLCERGKILQRQSQSAKAKASYEQALRECPSFHDAHRFLGVSLLELSLDAEAVSSFDQFLARSPLVIEVYTARTKQVRTAAGIVEAKSLPPLHDEAIPPRQSLAAVYRDRGLARLKCGDARGAQDDFVRARELIDDLSQVVHPADQRQFATMYARHGWSYILESSNLAIEAFNKCIAVNPHNADSYLGRGCAYVRLGKWEPAVQDAHKALELYESAAVYYNAAGILAEAAALIKVGGDSREKLDDYTGQSLDLLRQCLERWPESAAFFRTEAQSDHAFHVLRGSKQFQDLIRLASSP